MRRAEVFSKTVQTLLICWYWVSADRTLHFYCGLESFRLLSKKWEQVESLLLQILLFGDDSSRVNNLWIYFCGGGIWLDYCLGHCYSDWGSAQFDFAFRGDVGIIKHLNISFCSFFLSFFLCISFISNFLISLSLSSLVPYHADLLISFYLFPHLVHDWIPIFAQEWLRIWDSLNCSFLIPCRLCPLFEHYMIGIFKTCRSSVLVAEKHKAYCAL